MPCVPIEFDAERPYPVRLGEDLNKAAAIALGEILRTMRFPEPGVRAGLDMTRVKH
jgi:hypothetical protein